MSRTLSRGPILTILAVALLFWTGCSDDTSTGPRTPGGFDDFVVPTSVTMSNGQTYTIRDVGTLGGSWSEATGVNEQGWVVGVSLTADGYQHAFAWSDAGGMRDLNGSAWTFSRAEAVNNDGKVVGWGIEAGKIRGFTWTSETGMVSLGVPSQHTSSYAFNVNEAGEVVGMGLATSGTFTALVWSSPTNVTILGNLGGTASKALDINEEGRVAGKSTLSSSLSRAVMWVPLNPTVNLGTLGGSQSEALGINEIHQVVGWAHDVSGNARPFLWPIGNEMIDLQTLGGDDGEAWEINDAGFTVGESEITADSDVRHATLWTPEGEVVDLGPLDGSNDSHARDINGVGTVVGFANTPAGDKHAVMWTVDGGTEPPDPEDPPDDEDPPGDEDPPDPPEPEDDIVEVLGDLQDEIGDLLEDGAITKGHARSMMAKIVTAQRKIRRDDPEKAISSLEKIVRLLETLVDNGKLEQEEAQPLLDLVQAAIDLLGG